MSYIPIEKIVPQYVDGNGKPYAGAVLKAYASGTSNNIPFAIDSDGTGLTSTISLNASGYPVVSGNVVIPHLDQNYKLALYPNQTSADSNSNAVWVVDKIVLSSASLSGGQLTGVGSGTARDSAASVGQIQDGGLLYLGTTTGVDNAYNASPSPAVTAYNNKMTFMAKIHLTNGINPKPSLQLNNIANPATNAVIKKLDASKNEIDIEASDMLAGGIYKFQRNSSNDAWILLNPDNQLIASAKNIVKSSFSSYGVSYLERPIEISNGTVVNSINFLKGIVSFDDGSGQVVLESNMVKHLYTTVWEKGDNKGGLFGGVGSGTLISAESFYHCFVIYNPTTGEVDCGFSTTLDAQARPAGFTKYKRVGSFRTDTGRNIMMGTYIYDRKGGYHFTYNNPVADIQHIGGGNTRTTKQISVPPIPVLAYLRAYAHQSAANSYFYIRLFQPGVGSEPLIYSGAVDAGSTSSTGYIPTKDATIDYQYGAAGGNGDVSAYTLGWYDPCLYTPIALDFHLAPLSIVSSGTSTNTNTGGAANPSGSNTQIQYNKNGVFGANAGLTYDETSNNLSITGSIKSGALTASTLLAADANKNIYSLPVATYPSFDELSRIKGLSTQLQPKLSSLESDIAGKAPNAIFTGSNAVTDGQTGLVPKPLIVDKDKYLKGDGTWSSVLPSGSNTQIQFNDNGSFGSDADFVYDKVNDVLRVKSIAVSGGVTAKILNATDEFIVDKIWLNQQISIKDATSSGQVFVIKPGETLTANRNIVFSCDDSDVNINFKHAANPFVGSTVSVNGVKGLVPAPTTNDTNKYLKGDGTWSNIAATNPGGSNTQIQFNNNGSFGGSSNFTYNDSTNTLSVNNINSSSLTSLQTQITSNASSITSLQTTVSGKASDTTFTGSTVSTNGVKGLVPAPTTSDVGKYLKADGTWSTVSSGSVTNPGGSNTQIQFNDSGVFSGSSGLTFDKTNNSLSVVGNIKSDVLTASQLLASDGSKNIQSLSDTIYPSLDELKHVKGATSPLQTQINTNSSNITTLQNNVTNNSNSISSLQTTVASKANDSVFTGDSGSGGVKGLVPAPAAGDSAKVLSGNGQWVNLPTIPNVAGSNTQIQFNDGGSFAGNSNFTFDKTTNTLNVTNITSNSLTSLQTTVNGKANDTAFTGSTASVNGVKGLVPAPLIADRQRFLKGDGTWADINVTATSPGGADTQVQFNDGGSFGGNTGFTYNKTTNALTITGAFNSGALTALQLLASDASKNIQSLSTTIYPSLDELKHVKGGTSAFQSQIDTKAPLASPTFTGTVKGVSIPFSFAISDETTAITTGTAKITFRAPYACTMTAVRASLSTASTSGNPTFDINKNGVSMLSTTLSIDANEKTSVTAATAAVISTSSIADDDEITIDIDTAGTGAKGAKITIYLTRV